MKVRKLTETAKLPTKEHHGDLGYDLYADESVIVSFGEIVQIKTGIAIEFPQGIGGIIKGRSGLARDHGLSILGGVIDSDYRGEIIVLATICKKDVLTFLGKGQKIAQLVFTPVAYFQFEETIDPLPQTIRNDKGFGSSGN